MLIPFDKWRKVAILVALALAGVGAYQYLLRRPLPKVDGAVALPGLDAEVEVIRDQWGVPHIFAANSRDLYRAQGYVHAQDRLWQMELQRRLGSGRLSELFGRRALEADRLMRRVGMHRVAEAEARALAGDAKEALESYCLGVNAYIRTAARNLPLEYALLRARPEPWRMEDTLVWAKTMAWGLSTNWETELLRARIVALVGPEEAARLEPAYPPGHPLIAPPGVDYAGIGDQLLETYQQIKELLQMSSEAIGSNNWVIDGDKSATGKPLLANDPHLLPLAPSLWYEVHLCSPDRNVVGASLPGAPGVVIGHNQRIAWGMTASAADVQDLYVERLHPTDPTLYQFRGNWEKAQAVREKIKIRGQAGPEVEEVKITCHGPIISPVGPVESGPLALRWAGLEPGNMLAGVLRLNRASNWEEFAEAVRDLDSPSQNVVYADVEGNIGYYLSGKIPLRAGGNGMVPAPGWTGEYEWVGYVPFEELPHTFNPKSHFIVTANNKVVSDGYPHFISSEWRNGYRARRIADLIQSKDRLTVEDFKAIQGDCFSLPCSQLATHLADLVPKDRRQGEALRRVMDWDGHLTAETVGGAVCQAFLWRLQAKVFGHKLPGLVDDYLGAGFHPVVPTTAFLSRSTPILLDLLDKRDGGWFAGYRADGSDSPMPWQAVLEESFEEAVAFLRQKLGDDVSRWRWGRLHRVSFSHVFANLRPLHLLFNRGPYPIGGDADTVCQSAYLPHEPFHAASIATFRQIVDLSDFSKSVMMHAPGQSGHPASPHYDDLVQPWLSIRYHPMLFDRKEVLAHARHILRLTPVA